MSELEGIAELTKKLNELGSTMAAKNLRQATTSATLPAFKNIKMAAPVGSVEHRTYKGNLVSPGFLSRSIRRSSFIDRRKGKAVTLIGVRREAFYGINFLDSGTKNIPATHWFRRAFIEKRSEMESRLKAVLKKKIAKVARR